jgi:hypothetical protein
MGQPDFTGTWTFNAATSRLQIPAPESSEFAIEQRDPRFRLTRTLVIQGHRDTFSIDLTTDGSPFHLAHPRGYEIHGRAYWDGDVLAFDSTIGQGDQKATNEVRYHLSDDGRTLTAEERFRSRDLSYDNVWVLDLAGNAGEVQRAK